MRGSGLGLCGPGWSPVIGFVNVIDGEYQGLLSM